MFVCHRSAKSTRKIRKDLRFVQSTTNPESAAWHSFVLITQNFLGNRNAENYQALVANMLSKFRDLGVKMSIKVHYLFSHLGCFPANLRDRSEEHGLRFHQDIKIIKKKI